MNQKMMINGAIYQETANENKLSRKRFSYDIDLLDFGMRFRIFYSIKEWVSWLQ